MEQGQEKKYSSKETLDILNMLDEDDRELLLLAYQFIDIENIVNSEMAYLQHMKDMQEKVDQYNVMTSVVRRLRTASLEFDKKPKPTDN